MANRLEKSNPGIEVLPPEMLPRGGGKVIVCRRGGDCVRMLGGEHCDCLQITADDFYATAETRAPFA